MGTSFTDHKRGSMRFSMYWQDGLPFAHQKSLGVFYVCAPFVEFRRIVGFYTTFWAATNRMYSPIFQHSLFGQSNFSDLQKHNLWSLKCAPFCGFIKLQCERVPFKRAQHLNSQPNYNQPFQCIQANFLLLKTFKNGYLCFSSPPRWCTLLRSARTLCDSM